MYVCRNCHDLIDIYFLLCMFFMFCICSMICFFKSISDQISPSFLLAWIIVYYICCLQWLLDFCLVAFVLRSNSNIIVGFDIDYAVIFIHSSSYTFLEFRVCLCALKNVSAWLNLYVFIWFYTCLGVSIRFLYMFSMFSRQRLAYGARQHHAARAGTYVQNYDTHLSQDIYKHAQNEY